MNHNKARVLQQMVALLKQDSRMKLRALSERTGVPKSTLHDYMKDIRQQYWFTIVEKSGNLPENPDIDLRSTTPQEVQL